jgi:hypothetical protein
VPSTDHPDGDPAALEDPELEDEELEYEDDEYYEDELVLLTPRPEFGPELDRAGVLARTRETLALLRHMRRAHLREQAVIVSLGDFSYVV